jgi:hypothetical protein
MWGEMVFEGVVKRVWLLPGCLSVYLSVFTPGFQPPCCHRNLDTGTGTGGEAVPLLLTPGQQPASTWPQSKQAPWAADPSALQARGHLSECDHSGPAHQQSHSQIPHPQKL